MTIKVTCEHVDDLVKAFQTGKTKFHNIVLPKANLVGAFLPFIKLEKACLYQSDCRHIVLPGAELKEAYLAGSSFEHANLLSADLRGANLNQAKLDHALLSSADLRRANLRGASLFGARLANTDLRFADLRNTNLSGVILQGANLSEANLFGARLDPKALEDAILDKTILPNGQCQIGTDNAKPPAPQRAGLVDPPLYGDSHINNSVTALLTVPVQYTSPLTVDSHYPTGDLKQALPTPHTNKPRWIGFRVSEDRADLVLEIMEEMTDHEKDDFICIDHLL